LDINAVVDTSSHVKELVNAFLTQVNTHPSDIVWNHFNNIGINTISKANGSWIGFRNDALIFHEGKCIKFPYREGSNLPVAKLAPGISKFKAFQAVCGPVTELSMPTDTIRGDNLSAASRKLLRFHHCLGHKGFSKLQQWAATGSNHMPPEIATCPVPVCRACQYGAAKKCPHEKSNTGSVSGSQTAPVILFWSTKWLPAIQDSFLLQVVDPRSIATIQ
jgi:hypothetical protein